MKAKKGIYGYFRREKKRRALVTLVMFLIPLLIFCGGLLYYKTRMNVVTVIAVVGCLPACKSTVGLIMALMQRSLDPEEYRRISEAAGDLTMLYEMYITSYEKSGYVDAFAVCGNEVVGYSSDDRTDVKHTASNVQKMLRQNGLGVNVKILREMGPYLERLRSLRDHREALEKEVSYKPDPRYPDLDREELIRHLILAVSL